MGVFIKLLIALACFGFGMYHAYQAGQAADAKEFTEAIYHTLWMAFMTSGVDKLFETKGE